MPSLPGILSLLPGVKVWDAFVICILSLLPGVKVWNAFVPRHPQPVIRCKGMRSLCYLHPKSVIRCEGMRCLCYLHPKSVIRCKGMRCLCYLRPKSVIRCKGMRCLCYLHPKSIIRCKGMRCLCYLHPKSVTRCQVWEEFVTCALSQSTAEATRSLECPSYKPEIKQKHYSVTWSTTPLIIVIPKLCTPFLLCHTDKHKLSLPKGKESSWPIQFCNSSKLSAYTTECTSVIKLVSKWILTSCQPYRPNKNSKTQTTGKHNTLSYNIHFAAVTL